MRLIIFHQKHLEKPLPLSFAMKISSPSRGFALVATLAILVVVTIFLVAFASTMRTERAASQNFVDRDRAEAIGLGMINRIMAEHASPIGLNGARVLPYALFSDGSGLPDDPTAVNYYGATANSSADGPTVPVITDTAKKQTLERIYRMAPDNIDFFKKNNLVKTSVAGDGGGEGKPAYTAQFWSYDGLTQLADAAPGVTPQWVDYFQPDDPSTGDDESVYPVAQVAFAIWDEGGKYDANMVGEDKTVNGIAPHNLGMEQDLAAGGGSGSGETPLTSYLDNDSKRDRNNFSLRAIKPFSGASVQDDKGNDRRLFSVRELIQRGLIDPNKFNQVTTGSRDFDVRPEWDGDRAPKTLRSSGATLGAEDFLRSYINNPALYGLFFGAGSTGPYLVYNNLNENALWSRIEPQSSGLVPRPDTVEKKADWMQVMRLLAVLRRGLPPYAQSSGNTGILDSTSDAGPGELTWNIWSPYDIWGIGLNIVQATDAASDFNLTAYNSKVYAGDPRMDQNARLGIRISPYITEAAFKIKRMASGSGYGYQITPYIKIWNPYPYRLTYKGADIKYRVGTYTGQKWPNNSQPAGAWTMGDSKSRADNITAPPPGEFKVIRLTASDIITSDKLSQQWDYTNWPPAGTSVPDKGIEIRMRPYIQDISYNPVGQFKTDKPETPYFSIQFPGYYQPDTAYQVQLLAFIPKNRLPATNGSYVWYSFQIDDPRMGSLKRHASTPRLARLGEGAYQEISPDNYSTANFKWTWVGFFNQQALKGVPLYSITDTLLPADPEMDSTYKGRSFTVGGKDVPGYNQIFGINWPGASATDGVTDQAVFEKMMATFSLPGRPFLNIGELGSVYAFRPWVNLNFANRIIPKAVSGSASVPPASLTNPALLRPAAFLDYFTTVGTSGSIEPGNANYLGDIRYFEPGDSFTGSGRPPKAEDYESKVTPARLAKRYQDKAWLFEKRSGTADSQTIEGNLRAIRGRINLNTASEEVLTNLLKAPYRMPASIGLQSVPRDGELENQDPGPDYFVKVDEADARAMAQAITLPVEDSRSIRPLRMLSDLSLLYDRNEALMKRLYDNYPQTVVTAMIGRLAQFGTVRQQSYTIDMVVRTLNPVAQKMSGKQVVTGEARLQARVYFDTFSRKTFIESVQYK